MTATLASTATDAASAVRAVPSHRRRPLRKRIASIALGIAAAVVFFASAFPVYWMVNTSFQPNSQVRGTQLHFWPDNFTVENYEAIIFDYGRAPFVPALLNSLQITLITVVLALVFAFLAALAVTRFRFRTPGGVHRHDPHRPDDPGRGDDHLDLPPDRRMEPAQLDHRACPPCTSPPCCRSRSGPCAAS